MRSMVAQGAGLLAGLALLLLGQPLVAGAGDWTAESEYRTSDADSRSLMLTLDRSVGERGLAFVSLGETRMDGGDNALNTRSQSLGGLYRLASDWRVSGFYERWGSPGDIVSDRVVMTLSRDYEAAGFSLTGGTRWITLKAGAPARTQAGGGGGPHHTVPVDPGDDDDPDDGATVAEDYDLRAINLGLRFRYRPTAEWTLGSGYSYYDYDRDPRQLMTRDQMERLSASAVTLAQGFLERSVYVDARYDLGAYRELSAYLSRDRSAVDGRDAVSLIFSYVHPLAAAWDLRLEAGRTRTDGFDATHAVGIGLTWFP